MSLNSLTAPSLAGELLTHGAIAPRVSAATKRQALAVIAEIAARNYHLKAPLLFDALMAREAVGSTGLGHGVAIPHAQIKGLDQIRGVFVRLRPAVAFDAVDDAPVDLIFAIFAPPDGGCDHLRALARVARSLRSADLRQRLRQASSVDSIHALLSMEARATAA